MVDFTSLRLDSHGLSAPRFKNISEVISHYGAIQGQDFAWSKWAIGSRLPGSTDADIEKALADKKIVRTWPMRGTLHLVDPEHVHWMLDLCASKTISGFKKRREFLGIDDKLAEKALDIWAKALHGGKVFSRSEMVELLKKKGIPMQTQRGYHLLCYAATKKLICFGPRQGKEDSFVLLDEWIPEKKKYTREEQLAKLAMLYVQAHGPVTVQDLTMRSGLGITDCKLGMELIKDKVETLQYENGTYYFVPTKKAKTHSSVLLLPGFDEYFLGYKDRSPIAHTDHHKNVFSKNGIFSPIIVVDGTVVGTRKRSFKKDSVIIETTLLDKKVKVDMKDLEKDAKRYTDFMEHLNYGLINSYS